MANKKTLSDALGMTSEQEAFIRGGTSKILSDAPSAPLESERTEKVVELKATTQHGGPSNETSHGKSGRTRRGPKQYNRPSDTEVLDQVLVPVTIRLQHRTSQALKRAYLEQKLSHSKPDTAQDIVEEAVGAWLEKAGYLD